LIGVTSPFFRISYLPPLHILAAKTNRINVTVNAAPWNVGNISDTCAVLASIATCQWGFKAGFSTRIPSSIPGQSKAKLVLEKLASGTEYIKSFSIYPTKLFSTNLLQSYISAIAYFGFESQTNSVIYRLEMENTEFYYGPILCLYLCSQDNYTMLFCPYEHKY